jgi:flagellin-like hook-associated protein FlgL|tara:strand:+ start:258 stop:1667 length:1410 start_codon:yes stop_codon:yes gene_type:complete
MISLGNLAEASLRAIGALSKSERAVAQATERLATGEKINHAADDAAGMAMAARMQSQIVSLQQGIENGMDGVNMVRTADSVIGDLIAITQRMRELYLQQANGTQSASEVAVLQDEIDALRVSLTELARQSEFNATPLFMEARQVPFTVGANMNGLITVDLPKLVDTIETPKSFENGDFEADPPGSASITGWDIVEQVIIFGTDSLGGHATPADPVRTGTDQNTPSNAGSMEVTPSSAQASEGSQSVRLTSTGITTAAGYDTVRGPALISQDQLPMKAGDTMSFDWRAQGGDDAYDVYAYLLNVDTGATVEILNDTGATTNWSSESATIPEDGTYRFVFVGGTFDATGGKAAGAQLFVDNVVATTTITTYDFTLATNTLAAVDQTIGTLLGHRGEFGAVVNRITHAVDALTMTGVNHEESHSVLTDTNYAKETSELAAASIINQAATGVLQQSHNISKRIFTSVMESVDQ